MRISTILPFTLVGSAFATLVPRDLPTVTAAFDAVGSAISNLDTSVLALTPTSAVPAAVADLTAKSKAILDALNTGAANIKKSAALSLQEALGLLNVSNKLVATTKTTIDDLISKKSIIEAAGQSAFVATQLTAIKTATQGLIDAVVSSVPSAVQSVAKTQANQVVTILDTGIKGFGGTVKRAIAVEFGA